MDCPGDLLSDVAGFRSGVYPALTAVYGLYVSSVLNHSRQILSVAEKACQLLLDRPSDSIAIAMRKASQD
jgi:hypothetical protein